MATRPLGKVYVTGADGFIGSHLVETLVKDGYDVTALCIYNSNGSFGWLDPFVNSCPKNLDLILGDVRDPFFLETTTKGHDTVFHLASLIAIPYSYVAPHAYVETNVVGTLNVAQACHKNSVKRLIHTSTSEVYGTAQTVPISEKHPLQGQSPYSASKIGADMLVDSYWRSFNLPAVTLRPFNTFGPKQSFRAVIPTIIGQILGGKRELELGSLEPTRDFNFVSNTVEAFLAVGQAPDDAVLGQVFNAGSGREISIGDLALLIGKLQGVDLSVSSSEARKRPEKSEVERLLADSSRLTKATGWTPKVTLEEGLHRTIEWLKTRKISDRFTQYVR